MTIDPNRLRVVRQWCQSLGVLSAVRISDADAEMKLATYAPLLAREFTAEAFNADSLAHVAAASIKGFPTYGELVAALRQWWRDNRPAPLALPAPEPPPLLTRDPPTPEIVEAVRRAASEAIAALRASSIARDTVGRSLDAGRPVEPRPRYLTPEQLDAINPLPNGHKRVAS
jgi:hypothetical protein